MNLVFRIFLLTLVACSYQPKKTNTQSKTNNTISPYKINDFSFTTNSPVLKSEHIFCDKTPCKEGQCLKTFHGLKVCSSAQAGDFCIKDTDCVSTKCASRGDGVKVCMGDSRIGDFCQAEADCKEGSCQQVSPPYKVCQ